MDGWANLCHVAPNIKQEQWTKLPKKQILTQQEICLLSQWNYSTEDKTVLSIIGSTLRWQSWRESCQGGHHDSWRSYIFSPRLPCFSWLTNATYSAERVRKRTRCFQTVFHEWQESPGWWVSLSPISSLRGGAWETAGFTSALRWFLSSWMLEKHFSNVISST